MKNHYEARRINEGSAAELAALNMSEGELQNLINIQARIEEKAKKTLQLKSGSAEELDVRNDINLHNEFHFAIYNSCANPVLVSIMRLDSSSSRRT